MAKAGVNFTKDNEYYTPKEFVGQFGRFDYDPATTKEKALKAREEYLKELNKHY
ncbi:MAG: hypothetical protein KDC72_08610 [Bacteroidetes bacterium]|nr:hypothetical protein [Bacteroidota bacterium]